MERRFIRSKEIRSEGNKIEGYAATFGAVAQLPGFRERIMPGAFTRALREKQDVVCLFNHNENLVLGRTTAGTLRLKQDSHGLFYSCDLPNTQAARDLRESIHRGDINGCSFAFTVAPNGQTWEGGWDAEWDDDDDQDSRGTLVRKITDLNLLDVSPVTHPAYPNTEVSARELELATAEVRSRRSVKCDPVREAKLRELDAKIEELEGTFAEHHANTRRCRLGILNLL